MENDNKENGSCKKARGSFKNFLYVLKIFWLIVVLLPLPFVYNSCVEDFDEDFVLCSKPENGRGKKILHTLFYLSKNLPDVVEKSFDVIKEQTSIDFKMFEVNPSGSDLKSELRSTLSSQQYDAIWIWSSDNNRMTQEVVDLLHQEKRKGVSFVLMGDGHPYYEEANVLIREFYPNENTQFSGDYEGGRRVRREGIVSNDADNEGRLTRHIVNSGLFQSVREGSNISSLTSIGNPSLYDRLDPILWNTKGDLTVAALEEPLSDPTLAYPGAKQNSSGQPLSRVIFHGGLSSIYGEGTSDSNSSHSSGTLQLFNNMACWSVGGDCDSGDQCQLSLPSRAPEIPSDILSEASSNLFQQISVGISHSCAVKTDGTAWCWGSGSSGLLGNGGTSNSLTPVQVSNLTNVKQISAGTSHSCAVKTDNTAWCWGEGLHGQLGNREKRDKSTPVKVSNLTNVKQINVGSRHTCAVKTDSTAWCWGEGSYGRLGNRGTSDSSTPVEVSNLTNVKQIGAGSRHTCAMKTDGTAWCWGEGQKGQLGSESRSTSYTPVKVSNLRNVKQINVGYWHNCAVKTDGTAWCWGEGGSGQLGNGDTKRGSTPVKVSNLTNVKQISAGVISCAVKTDGSSWCWGSGYSGQLGDGTTNTSNIPVKVSNLTNVKQISAGYQHSCAVKTDGTASCWGRGKAGQLGHGETNNSSIPVQVSNPDIE